MKFPKALRDKVNLTNELFEFAGNIGAVLGAVMAFLGITSNFASNTAGLALSIDVTRLSLPVRMTLLMLTAAALGWGMGALVAWLSRSRKEAQTFIAYVVALIWGGLLVGAADWLANVPIRQVLSETMLFTVVGCGVALWVSAFHFRSNAGRNRRALRTRCDALLLFSVGCAVFLCLTMLGGGA